MTFIFFKGVGQPPTSSGSIPDFHIYIYIKLTRSSKFIQCDSIFGIPNLVLAYSDPNLKLRQPMNLGLHLETSAQRPTSVSKSSLCLWKRTRQPLASTLMHPVGIESV